MKFLLRNKTSHISALLMGLVLALTSCSEAQSSTKRHKSFDRKFSYEVPSNWILQEIPGLKYNVCFPEFQQLNCIANINVVYEKSRLDPDAYFSSATLYLDRSTVSSGSLTTREEIISSANRFTELGVRLGNGLKPEMYTFTSVTHGITSHVTQAIAPAKDEYLIFTLTCRDTVSEKYTTKFVDLVRSISTDY